MTRAAIPTATGGQGGDHELRETLVLANMLIEALPAAIIVVDRDGLCRLLNAAAEDLLQIGRKTLLGRRLLGRDPGRLPAVQPDRAEPAQPLGRQRCRRC